MPTIRVSKTKIARGRGKVDRAKVDAFSEDDLERFAREDGVALDETAELRYSSEYVRAVRERLKLTQAEFARRFGLSERTIQEWEQGRAEPEGPARILLRVIDREPKAVERALRVS
ncbi:MAG: helix-turn-helix domain-containing protein [Vulcanimicrobiaceae bacterium]